MGFLSGNVGSTDTKNSFKSKDTYCAQYLASKNTWLLHLTIR